MSIQADNAFQSLDGFGNTVNNTFMPAGEVENIDGTVSAENGTEATETQMCRIVADGKLYYKISNDNTDATVSNGSLLHDGSGEQIRLDPGYNISVINGILNKTILR